VKTAGGTGANIAGETLTTTATGTVTVRATIKNGTAAGTDYTQDFDITIGAIVPVTGIIDVPESGTVGTALTLSGTVTPGNATNRDIVWPVKEPGDTGAGIDEEGTLTTTGPGTVTVTATIANGTAPGVDFTQPFTITINP
jgi:endo-1,4-beta-xylanase